MDSALLRLILILLSIAAGTVLLTVLLSLPQRGRRHAVWKYLPAVVFGAGFVWALVKTASSTEGFQDLAWFLTSLLALSGALPSLVAALLLGMRKRRRSERLRSLAPDHVDPGAK